MAYDLTGKFLHGPASLDKKAQEKDNVHVSGEEGHCPQDEDSQGESHPQISLPFLAGKSGHRDAELYMRSDEIVNKPGEEGQSGVGELRQGQRDVPEGTNEVAGLFLSGPEVRKTRVMPASGSDPSSKMPGA